MKNYFISEDSALTYIVGDIMIYYCTYLCAVCVYTHSQLSLLMIMLYKVTGNTELANTLALFLGEIQG